METMTTTTGENPGRAFRLAEGGHIAVINVSLVGNVREYPQLNEFYKSAASLKQRTYYLLSKHGVNTPFGYFITAKEIEEMREDLEDVQHQAKQINQLVNGAFRLYTHVTFAPLRSDDPTLCERLREYVVDCYKELREKLLAGKTTGLRYTQDPIHRLHIFCRGEHAKAVLRAYSEAESLAGEEEVSEKDFEHIDTMIALFERTNTEGVH